MAYFSRERRSRDPPIAGSQRSAQPDKRAQNLGLRGATPALYLERPKSLRRRLVVASKRKDGVAALLNCVDARPERGCELVDVHLRDERPHPFSFGY